MAANASRSVFGRLVRTVPVGRHDGLGSRYSPGPALPLLVLKGGREYRIVGAQPKSEIARRLERVVA